MVAADFLSPLYECASVIPRFARVGVLAGSFAVRVNVWGGQRMRLDAALDGSPL